jgi:acetylornithine aminotransferase
MNLAQKASVLVAIFALSSSADAFAVHRTSSSSSRLHSTIESSSDVSSIAEVGRVTTILVPPSKLPPHTTSELFDTRVQKTYGRYPITFVSGSGSTLTDETGKVYLDFVSGIATCALGHNNPELTKAVCDQMTRIHHVSNLYYTPQQGMLAAWLCENSCADKAFFCNSGAEANEAAIKLARRHASNRGITVSDFFSGFGGGGLET